MDPETALEATKQLGTLLLLDVPVGVELGLDGWMLITGEKFKGIKMIPPGMHYLSIHRTHPSAIPSPVSTFLSLKSQEISIYRWHPETEQLKSLIDEDEVDRLREGVRRFDFDDGLGPYDATHWKQWQRLSHRLDKALMDRIMNGLSWLSVAEEARGLEGLSMKIPSEAALVRQLQSHQSFIDRPQKLAYTSFPSIVTREGCTAAEITALNMDKTDALGDMLKEEYDSRWEALLGEMQFSFVTLLFGHSISGLEQWKQMMHWMLCCFDGPRRFPSLFREFLKLARHQFQCLVRRGETEDPSEASGILSGSFLRKDLMEYLKYGRSGESGWPEDVEKECRKLEGFLREVLQGEYPSEDDEYAPVVV